MAQRLFIEAANRWKEAGEVLRCWFSKEECQGHDKKPKPVSRPTERKDHILLPSHPFEALQLAHFSIE